MGKTLLTVVLTVLVVAGLFAVAGLGYSLFQSNSALADAREDIDRVSADRDSQAALAVKAVGDRDKAVDQLGEAETELIDTRNDLRRAQSEVDALRPAFDQMTCSWLEVMLPPASFNSPAILEPYLVEYVEGIAWPGAVVTNVEHWDAWTNDTSTWWDLYYSYAGNTGFIASFMVYNDGPLGYTDAIYAVNDECFIVPPAGDPATLNTSTGLTVQG
jgi:hypothetical protein